MKRPLPPPPVGAPLPLWLGLPNVLVLYALLGFGRALGPPLLHVYVGPAENTISFVHVHQDLNESFATCMAGRIGALRQQLNTWMVGIRPLMNHNYMEPLLRWIVLVLIHPLVFVSSFARQAWTRSVLLWVHVLASRNLLTLCNGSISFREIASPIESLERGHDG